MSADHYLFARDAITSGWPRGLVDLYVMAWFAVRQPMYVAGRLGILEENPWPTVDSMLWAWAGSYDGMLENRRIFIDRTRPESYLCR